MCVYVCVCEYAGAGSDMLAYRYQLWAKRDSDYFRPINALLILAVSL